MIYRDSLKLRNRNSKEAEQKHESLLLVEKQGKKYK
jgi:hypothetical protein